MGDHRGNGTATQGQDRAALRVAIADLATLLDDAHGDDTWQAAADDEMREVRAAWVHFIETWLRALRHRLQRESAAC